MLNTKKVIHVVKLSLESYRELINLGYVVVFVNRKECQ